VLGGGLEHLKMKTRLIDQKFVSVMLSVCVSETVGEPSIFRIIRKAAGLVRILSTTSLVTHVW
jgi:hypothetical protein